ncbi:Pentatricopeptide repeat-containing protein 5, mitochondrial [Hypsizygus marmoreus]|uniref:Pentatricopeptide repeat-containing protein 5, mitochondrial n=1 Tax=Hypsizygus marmoreus TaxID=39966 RepID=A0A369J835_HYPMA|nr:Pentatricopeptide repeat-containing protein 5, mitochondrial [Hypsizygus marmoreus]
MLPKVATHILHTTARTAASIHHQTHTIRNVLQLQSSSGSSSSTGHLAPWNSPGSSHWGNSGPGTGGAKYGTGSRYNGYTATGRAVTQANTTISSIDGSFTQSDDTEEPPRRPSIHTTKRTRIRSHSLSIPSSGRIERGETLGVLKTVQLHARSRHAFAPATSTESATPSSDATPPVDLETPPRPVLVRRNSTSAPLPTSDTFDPTVPAPSPKVFVRRNSTVASNTAKPDIIDSLPRSSSSVNAPLSPTDPAAPQTTEPPTLPFGHGKPSKAVVDMLEARNTGDHTLAAEAVRHFRQTTPNPSVREFNVALETLNATRRQGESLYLILETYNDMLKHSLLPNATTYAVLIDALVTRDHEIQRLAHTLEMRLKHRQLTGRKDFTTDEIDRKRIEALRKENNFSSAMSLFEGIISIGGQKKITMFTYLYLLRSCASHSNIDSAIHVFAQMEKRHEEFRPMASAYRYMIQTYTNAGQLKGAEEVFTEYRDALKRGDVYQEEALPANANRANLSVWNQMIETYFRFNFPDKAVELVDQMMGSQVDEAGLSDPPPVATSTFTTVLSGFCQMGDVQTALIWFDRLLQQSGTSEDPFETTGTAMKPDGVAWSVMLDALAVHGMIDDLNRLFTLRLKQPTPTIKATERLVVFSANMAHLKELGNEEAAKTLEFLFKHVVSSNVIPSTERAALVTEIWEAYITRGKYESAVLVLVQFLTSWVDNTSPMDVNGMALAPAIHNIQNMQLNFTRQLYEKTQGVVEFAVVLQLARIADRIRVMQQEEYTPFFLHSYGLSRAAGTLPLKDMTTRDWELLLYAAVELETAAFQGNAIHTQVPDYAFGGLVSLLGDLAKQGVPFDQMNNTLIRRIVHLIIQQRGADELKTMFEAFGPAFASVLTNPDQQPLALQEALDTQTLDSPHDSGYSSPTFMNKNIKLRIDPYMTKTIHAEFRAIAGNPAYNAYNAYRKFRQGVAEGKVPVPATMGLLIQNLGRASKMEEVHYVYTVAQAVLQLLESNKSWQAEAWFAIEDSMIIALAHHGDGEGAHVHRMRILEQGGAPSADAYGALIYHVKDTTDDTSNAMALFQEAQQQGVAPNQYLYNNIISKLAKARKADYALELFQQMKATNVAPSSVTYGAVIGACARVGDVHSAEMLFAEMVQSKNFKPRVPPYNTMMQMYTTTKPNRERALYFYEELRKAGVAPTAYTYKLLMDAYGAIEPVDIESMERVFKSLQEDQKIAIQGNHFATLINAYGCVKRDLNKAIEVFNSIPTYSRAQPVDAVVFEALINALVAHRRTDLIPEYIEKMGRAGVHMTAYIANFLIKGYAMVGDIEQARGIFESLQDPPEGMAAPNNHAPHEPTASPVVSQLEPVYREPSTWEAMVRAELGSGNRQGALDLLERLKARQYPEAVYNRISGIMVDHSMVLS